ncbi:hypothetical protein [Agromyces larvae]|uniref:Uncharacterized protein n=1 Tax=Agromyces larvae TaxID=2929802 RepID=A0ABY4C1Z7_9MICO|nr:hypothetical protein [Agromyces larvae]UOE45503.1 hypothetical protein MTO99_07025 [Agromyces larvae]
MSTSAQRWESKVRQVVEDAGFLLAIDMDHAGVFRIITRDEFATVAHVTVTHRGFTAFVVGSRVKVREVSPLVDELEAYRREAAG